MLLLYKTDKGEEHLITIEASKIWIASDVDNHTRINSLWINDELVFTFHSISTGENNMRLLFTEIIARIKNAYEYQIFLVDIRDLES
jgi:hypothetical protein